jgi:hypothetical protein
MPVGWSELPDLAGRFRRLSVVILLSAVLWWTEPEAWKSIITGISVHLKLKTIEETPTIQFS